MESGEEEKKERKKRRKEGDGEVSIRERRKQENKRIKTN